ncbi:MAG: hypothetical protein V4478_01235 [Patescibacteria group bacterium]
MNLVSTLSEETKAAIQKTVQQQEKEVSTALRGAKPKINHHANRINEQHEKLISRNKERGSSQQSA